MNLQKLNPWNWFKHEESDSSDNQNIPVKNYAGKSQTPVIQQMTSHPLMQFHQEVDRMFDDIFRGFGYPATLSGNSASSFIRPNLDISSDDSNYKINLELPGLKESDISVEVKNNTLTIQGEINEQKEDKDRDFYRVERSYGSFRRVLALPEDVNTDEINAVMKDGVLSLTLPRQKVSDDDIKKIAVNSAA